MRRGMEPEISPIAAAVATELTHGRWLRPEEVQSLRALEALRRSLIDFAEQIMGFYKNME